MKDEIVIRGVKPGEQNPVVEAGLSLLGQPPEALVWVTDTDTSPFFVTGKALGDPNQSGQYMMPVWTRVNRPPKTHMKLQDIIVDLPMMSGAEVLQNLMNLFGADEVLRTFNELQAIPTSALDQWKQTS